MTTRDSSADTPLSADDRRLVDQIRAGYAPPPLTAVERTRFDARLRARIERQRRRRWGLAGLVVAGVAAAAVAIFALRQPAPLPAGAPGALPRMAGTDPTPEPVPAAAVDDEAALDWLAADGAADWLGGSTVLPGDPLVVPTLDAPATFGDATAAVEGDAADAEEQTAADEDDGPAWMPEEYTVLAGLIEIEPYDPYAEDWP